MKAGPLPGYTKVTWLSKISWRTILSAEAGPHHPRPYFTPQCKMWAEADNDSVLRCPWHWQAGLWKLDWLRLSIVSLMWFTFLFIVLCSGVFKGGDIGTCPPLGRRRRPHEMKAPHRRHAPKAPKAPSVHDAPRVSVKMVHEGAIRHMRTTFLGPGAPS